MKKNIRIKVLNNAVVNKEEILSALEATQSEMDEHGIKLNLFKDNVYINIHVSIYFIGVHVHSTNIQYHTCIFTK